MFERIQQGLPVLRYAAALFFGAVGGNRKLLFALGCLPFAPAAGSRPLPTTSGEHEARARVGAQDLAGDLRPGLVVERFTRAVQRDHVVDEARPAVP